MMVLLFLTTQAPSEATYTHFKYYNYHFREIKHMEALLIILSIQHLKLFTSTCETIYRKVPILSNISILASKTKSDVNLAFLLSSNIKLEICYQKRIPK